MTSAYDYAESGGRIPTWLKMSYNVERYGAQALLGRPLTVNETYRMKAARSIHDAKKEQMKAENRAEWAQTNKEQNDLLIIVEKMLTELDNG